MRALGITGATLAVAAAASAFACGPEVDSDDVPYDFDSGGGHDAAADADSGNADTGGSNVTVIATGVASPYGVAADASNVYFTDSLLGVMACPQSGCAGGPTVLAPDGYGALWLAVDAANVYWFNVADEQILSCPIGGCATANVVATLPAMDVVLSFVSDGTRIYWGDGAQKSVLACPVAGCSSAPAVFAAEPAGGLAVAGGRLFWAAGGGVHDCPTSGCTGAPDVFVASPDGGGAVDAPREIATDGSNVLWSTLLDIYRCPLGGCGQQTVFAGADGPANIASDGTRTYFYGTLTNAVERCAATGCTSATHLADGEKDFAQLALGASRVFWTRPKAGQIVAVGK
jgi:hypothetical protein